MYSEKYVSGATKVVDAVRISSTFYSVWQTFHYAQQYKYTMLAQKLSLYWLWRAEVKIESV